MKFNGRCILALVGLLVLTGCLDNAIKGEYGPSPYDVLPSPPPAISIETIPSTSTETPTFSWDQNSDPQNLIDHIEIRVVRAADDVVVVDWTEVASGESLTGVTLDDTQIYTAEFRAVDQYGRSGATVVSSEPWIPNSLGCSGEKLTNTPYAGGAGTANDPFVICTATQLAAIAANPGDFTKYFKLAASVEMAGVAFDGIGSLASPFRGRFLGSSKTIHNLTINRSSGDRVGLFNAADHAYISHLTLVDPVIVAAASNRVGTLFGDCIESQAKEIGVTNLSVSGASEVGGFSGLEEICSFYNLTLSGTVTAQVSTVGGITGAAEKGKIINVTSTVEVNAPLASSVGGVYGEDWWSSTHFQNVHVTANVTGADQVGGFLGMNSDGSSIYRSSFTGTVTGNSEVGGVVGGSRDTPFSVYSTAVQATVNGNAQVGGFAGNNGEGAKYYDSYVVGTINGVGASQTDFGGFWGLVDYYGNITRSYASMTINSTATHVGGAVGRIAYWSPSYDIVNSFTTSTVSGSSASPWVSLFLGKNEDPNPLTASGSYYWSGASCTNSGGGGCNTTSGAAQATLGNFYDSTQAPLSSWDFSSIWVENPGALPTLNWTQFAAPSVSFSCPNNTLVAGTPYTCELTITDTDLNETQMVLFDENHTCLWLSADDAYLIPNRLEGTPGIGEVGTCKVSFAITDGTNVSPTQTYDIIVQAGVGMSSLQSTNGDLSYDFGYQATGSGPKTKTFTLTNTSSVTATGIGITGVTATFGYDNGIFPGSAGTCGTTLGSGLSCTVVIGFDPSSTGLQTQGISLHYDLGSGDTSYAVTLSGTGY